MTYRSNGLEGNVLFEFHLGNEKVSGLQRSDRFKLATSWREFYKGSYWFFCFFIGRSNQVDGLVVLIQLYEEIFARCGCSVRALGDTSTVSNITCRSVMCRLMREMIPFVSGLLTVAPHLWCELHWLPGLHIHSLPGIPQ